VRCCPCSRPRFLRLFNRGCGPGLLQSGRPREALCSNHRARLPCCCGQGAKGVLLQSQSAQQKKSLQSKATSTKEISPIKSQTNLQRTIKLAAEKKYQSLLVFQKNQNLKNKTLTHPLLHKLQSSSSLYNKEYLQNSPLTITYYKLIQF